MKFAKPRELRDNDYPDMIGTQPSIMRSIIRDRILPKPGSEYDKYIEQTIREQRDDRKRKNKKVSLNVTDLGENLYFIICHTERDILEGQRPTFKTLIDTGATNSLIHISVAKRLNLKITPTKLRLKTATGTDDEAIKGISHIKFFVKTEDGNCNLVCTNFLVSDKLNGMESILGAEFLFNRDEIIGINGKNIVFERDGEKSKTRIWKESECENVIEEIDRKSFRDMSCIKCGNKNGKNTKINYTETITLNHAFWNQERKELESENGAKSKLEIDIMAHTVRDTYREETLLDGETEFDESLELKYEALDKKITLDMGDYSHCPREWRDRVDILVNDFEDRFSKSKLDLEITDKYLADLETIPGKKVVQKVRFLPPDKYNFTIKALRQLEEAGVVRESDSDWRSNVVLIPKPVKSNELRSVSKADMQRKDKAELYRICLDFTDLNKLLIFSKQVQFTTLDKFLSTLKNKVVVSLDISSSFFIIPIREEDKHKTSFWVNDLAFEFNVLVMGLKSSPYHLKMFMDQTFNKENYEKLSAKLSMNERKLLPGSFDKIIVSYFDDCFIYADSYEELLPAFKLCLMAAREAKIKFSIEKTTFFTTKIKVLGYEFDTRNVELTMDKLKASAILNMKKPSSLFELHSRLCSFQYQSMFIPWLKHISYPLRYLLKKGEFKWGKCEEESWQMLKSLATLNLRLTIPDPHENLVLYTDASKVAAAACLFREKNGKLELVSVNSKQFSTADLNKCSYILESIALAFGLRSYASYILNCEAKVTIFTDAKSLIFAKRNASHSMMLNSALTYLARFVSLVNVEIFHVPGTVNVLADILSRAISENLNCRLPKEHEISKQWAAQIPPVGDKFYITHEALFKFLTSPLEEESMDTFDKRKRRLLEPRSVQQLYDDAKKISEEQKYYDAVRLLRQWNDNSIKNGDFSNIKSSHRLNHTDIEEARLRETVHANKLIHDQVEEVMNKIYPEIKGTPIFTRLLRALEESSKRYIKASVSPKDRESVRLFNEAITETTKILEEGKQLEIFKKVKEKSVEKIVELNATKTKGKWKHAILRYILKEGSELEPIKRLGEYRGYLRSQHTYKFNIKEALRVDVGVRFQVPEKCMLELVPENNELKKLGLLARTGFLEIGMRTYLTLLIQNVSEKEVYLEKGQILCKFELRIVNNLRVTEQLESEEIDGRSDMMIDFELEKVENDLKLTKQILDAVDPYEITINAMEIKIFGNREDRVSTINELLDFEEKNTWLYSSKMAEKFPKLQTFDKQEMRDIEEDEEIDEEELDRLIRNDSDAAVAGLLAAELHETKKISLENLIWLQSKDKKISEIKEMLLGNGKEYKNFVLRSELVCRVNHSNSETNRYFSVYIPSAILYAVIIYVHKHFQHPSQTQTYKEFQALYYHPMAKVAVRNIFRKCMVCALARNSEKRQIPIGRERTLRPENPRECISMDILYFPKSKRGYTHGLIISDLYSLYVSFYPLKNKNSRDVAKALRSYVSAHGTPKTVYSDNDPSFRGDVEILVRQYGIGHMTSYPYCQKQNSVESQVRTFKNAYRAAILDNEIFKTQDWDILYPLVVCRINSMITKYGMSRETVHYGYAVESSLPLITDASLFAPFEEDLKITAERFKERMGRFMQRRKRNKTHYKVGKEKKFYVNELVMYKVYVPESAIHSVFKGPARIKDVQEAGATIKDTKTGDEFSVGYENLRKIEFDEFLNLLPQNFDDEITQTLRNYRYRRSGNDSQVEADQGIENRENEKSKLDETEISRRTRSGKIFNVKLDSLPEKYKGIVRLCTKRWICIPKVPQKIYTVELKSCLRRRKYAEKVRFPERDPIFKDGVYVYKDELREDRLERIKRFRDKLNSTGLNSSRKCTQEIVFKEGHRDRRVTFGKVTAFFF